MRRLRSLRAECRRACPPRVDIDILRVEQSGALGELTG